MAMTRMDRVSDTSLLDPTAWVPGSIRLDRPDTTASNSMFSTIGRMSPLSPISGVSANTSATLIIWERRFLFHHSAAAYTQDLKNLELYCSDGPIRRSDALRRNWRITSTGSPFSRSPCLRRRSPLPWLLNLSSDERQFASSASPEGARRRLKSNSTFGPSGSRSR